MSAKSNKIANELYNEICILRSKLDTKCKSLLILSQDLIKARRERDEFKLMADQLRERHSTLKKRMQLLGPSLCDLNGVYAPDHTTFAEIICDLKKENKALKYNVEELATKLTDAEGDIKLLREQNIALRAKNGDESAKRYHCDTHFNYDIYSSVIESKSSNELMCEIEMFKNRCEQQEMDLKAILDEKEELIVSRDAYKAKVERLNERLNELLRLSPTDDGRSVKIIDIDSLINENKFLKDKITQLEEERTVTDKTLNRYKTMLEKGNLKKNVFNPKSKASQLNERDLTSMNFISTKDVQSFIATNNLSDLKLTDHNLKHLKSLVIALFEALSDKSSAFALQKKNNRLLGKRIQELEERMKDLQAKESVHMLTREASANWDLFGSETSDDGSNENNSNEISNSEPVNCTEEEEGDEEEFKLPPELEELVNNEMQKLNTEEDETGEDELKLPPELEELVKNEIQKLHSMVMDQLVNSIEENNTFDSKKSSQWMRVHLTIDFKVKTY